MGCGCGKPSFSGANNVVRTSSPAVQGQTQGARVVRAQGAPVSGAPVNSPVVRPQV
mgnify:CR=1 FL=1